MKEKSESGSKLHIGVNYVTPSNFLYKVLSRQSAR
jgi:hypothetical protein